MPQDDCSEFPLFEECDAKDTTSLQSYDQTQLPYCHTEISLNVSVPNITELPIKGKQPEPKVYFADELEQESALIRGTPDQAKKSRRVSKEGLEAACLLDQFKVESYYDEEGSPQTPQMPPPPMQVSLGPCPSSTPPQTPPRATRTPQGKPPRPWSPANPKKASTPVKYPVPCTPPRQGHRPPRMVHNPYRLPGTPPPKSPGVKQSPMLRASPKQRTPTRTRLAVQKQNTPSPGLSLSSTPQPRLSMALRGTPSATPTRSEPDTSPLFSIGGRKPDTPFTATQFLQYTAENLPPSLQTPVAYGGATRSVPEDRVQVGYGPQYAALSDALRSPGYASTSSGNVSPYAQIQIQSVAGSPLIANYSSSQPASVTWSMGPSPNHSLSPLEVSQAPISPTPSVVFASPTPSYNPRGPSSQNDARTKMYVLVEFKRGRTVQYQSPFFAQPGQFLLVEGDEGEDMGMVTHAWVAPSNSPPVVNNSLNSNKASSGRDVDPTTGDPIYPKVIRQATSREVYYMHNAQAQAEIKCTEYAKQKVLEHGLSMTILDAEYQFDRKKLTFYYDSPDRVDFRDLIRDLFKLYRARIWMSKVRSQDSYDDRRMR